MIELLVTVALIGILSAIAAPNFLNFIRNNRAVVQSSTVVNALHFARTEAARRGQNVYMTSLDGTNWNQGWRIWADKNNNQVFDSGVDEVIQNRAELPADSTLTGNVAEIAFNNLGHIAVAGATPGWTGAIVYSSNNDCKLGRTINVAYIGHVAVTAEVCP